MSNESDIAPTVTIVGAGVAGMTAALRLLQAGHKVRLIEKSEHPGGKFGAKKNSGHYHEHSYHFFAKWCVNFWDIVDAIGLARDKFEDHPSYKFLRRDGAPDAPKYTQLTNVGSPYWFWENVDSKVKHWYDMMIYVYSTADLLAHDLENEENRYFLNTISVNGFMFSRPYATDEAAKLHQEVLLKTFSIPSYQTSARTYRKFLKYAVAEPEPTFQVLKENSQELFCDRFLTKLKSFGDNFEYTDQTSIVGLRVDRGKRVITGIELDKNDARSSLDVDQLILAIPCEQLWALIRENQELYDLAPGLFKVGKLQSRAMASLDVYFKTRLPDTIIPREHVTLVKSKFGLSFVDNSRLWESYKTTENRTILNLVASDYETLLGIDKERAKWLIFEELIEYLPISKDAVEHIHIEPNTDAPLFLNEVGSWENRPEMRPIEELSAKARADWEPMICDQIYNLYLAGDYCRNKIDVVCVEGAIYSGILAARVLSRKISNDKNQWAPRPKRPKEYSMELYRRGANELKSWLEAADRVARIAGKLGQSAIRG